MFQMETISPKMLDYYVGRSDALIIDLRAREEFAEKHVRGAVNIPYEEIDEGKEEFCLPKDRVLVLYCHRGSASLLLAKKLANAGYRTRSVIGGFRAYRGRNLVISPQA